MDKYSFGEFIYRKRKEKGLTQDELGRRLGLTNKAVSKWETGETLPEISMLESLAKELGVTVDELLTQKSPEPVIKIKERKTPWILMSCFIAISIVLIVILIFKSVKKPVEVTKDNYADYYSITLAGSKMMDTSLEVYIHITDNNVTDSNLKLSYTILYYYEVDGKEGVISYANREIEYTGVENDFTISVNPEVNISGDYSFKGFDVTYVVLDAEGEILQ